MRNVSRQGEARQDKVANSCIYRIRHLASVDESPAFAETECGILYRANYISLSILHINQTCLSNPMLPSAPSLLFMGFPPLWIPLPNSLSPHSCVRVSLDTSVH